MKAYSFEVIVEPDEDRWHAYCPALEKYGAATWGDTRDEALRHIDEVVRMVVEELAADGVAIPDASEGSVTISRVAVTA